MKRFLFSLIFCVQMSYSAIVFTDRDVPEDLIEESISARSLEFGLSYSPVCCNSYFDPAMGTLQLAGAFNVHLLFIRKHGFRYSFSFENFELSGYDIPDNAETWELNTYEHSLEYIHRWVRGWHSGVELGIGAFVGLSFQSYEDKVVLKSSSELAIHYPPSYKSTKGVRFGVSADIRFLSYFFAELSWGIALKEPDIITDEADLYMPHIEPHSQIFKISMGVIYRIGL